jgi:hypothetical protein
MNSDNASAGTPTPSLEDRTEGPRRRSILAVTAAVAAAAVGGGFSDEPPRRVHGPLEKRRTNAVTVAVPGGSINVMSYGATGDGTTDDTGALQSALNDVPAGGGIVDLPRGTYVISAPLTPKADTTMRGAARDTTTIEASSFGFPGIDLYDVDGCTVETLTLSCVGARVDLPTPFRGDAKRGYVAGVYTNGSRHTFRGVTVSGFSMGITLSNYVTGGTLSGAPSGNSCYDITFHTVDHGLLVYGQQSLTIDGLVCQNHQDSSAGTNPTHAVYTTSATPFTSDIIARNMYDYNNATGCAFQFKNCSRGDITNLHADNTAGVLNLLNVQELAIRGITGLHQRPLGQSSAIAFQGVGEAGCRIAEVSIEMMVPRRAVQLYGSNNMIETMTLRVNRGGAGAMTLDDYDIVIGGSANSLRHSSIIGSPRPRGRAVGISRGSAHSVDHLRTKNVRTSVDIRGRSGEVTGDLALLSSEPGYSPVNYLD